MPIPRVSICIPTWRGGDFLEAAIQSVLSQTFTDFELVVVDDCSGDDTVARVQKYAADPRLRCLVNQDNLGPEGNWNRCLSEARGEYIKLLPHDDLIAPECLATQVAILDEYRDVTLTFSSRQVIGSDDKVLLVKGAPVPHGRVGSRALLRKCVRYGTNLIGEPGAVLFRRSAAQRVGAFSAAVPYVIDLDYWARLLALGDAWYVPRPLASFRVSRASWSVSIGRAQAAEFTRFALAMSAAPHVDANAVDRLSGRTMANINALARHFIYKAVLR